MLYTFNPPSQKEILKEFHNINKDPTGLNSSTSKAAERIPAPNDNKTLFVNKTMMIANSGGTNEKIVFSKTVPP